MCERELVLKAREGDVKAFCILYDNYKARLYNYAYCRLGNCYDAEDAVSDCILCAFEQIHQLRKPESFSSWLFRILYCCCAEKIKLQIAKRNADNIDDYTHLASHDSEAEIERTELLELLGILNEDERSIVLLSVVAGLKSKEISKITGYTAGNVRQKLSKSLKKMREYYKE